MKNFYILFCFLFLSACSGGAEKSANEAPETESVRCVWCAMNPAKYPKWATYTEENGTRKALTCSPRCLFFARESGKIPQSGKFFFTEYYGQEILPAESLFFVTESDLTGPMGVDFVPVKDSLAAVEFRNDHKGNKILRFEAVEKADLELLK